MHQEVQNLPVQKTIWKREPTIGLREVARRRYFSAENYPRGTIPARKRPLGEQKARYPVPEQSPFRLHEAQVCQLDGCMVGWPGRLLAAVWLALLCLATSGWLVGWPARSGP